MLKEIVFIILVSAISFALVARVEGGDLEKRSVINLRNARRATKSHSCEDQIRSTLNELTGKIERPPANNQRAHTNLNIPTHPYYLRPRQETQGYDLQTQFAGFGLQETAPIRQPTSDQNRQPVDDQKKKKVARGSNKKVTKKNRKPALKATQTKRQLNESQKKDPENQYKAIEFQEVRHLPTTRLAHAIDEINKPSATDCKEYFEEKFKRYDNKAELENIRPRDAGEGLGNGMEGSPVHRTFDDKGRFDFQSFAITNLPTGKRDDSTANARNKLGLRTGHPDQAGHILAWCLGGSSTDINNFFAQDAKMNIYWGQNEKLIKEYVNDYVKKEGIKADVRLSFAFEYQNDEDERPILVHARLTLTEEHKEPINSYFTIPNPKPNISS